MPRNGVHQRTVVVTTARMNDKSGRLVHHQQVIVLINNFQRNIFSFYRVFIERSVKHHDNLLERLYLIIAFHGPAVNIYKSGIRSTLYTVTACVMQLVKQELVYPQRFLPLIHNYAEMFVQRLLPVVLHLIYIVLAHCFNHIKPQSGY